VGLLEMKLIPFDVVETFEETSEVPEGVKEIKAPDLWAKGITGTGVVVAVLDTGMAPHSDLQGRIIGGRNFTSTNAEDYTDRHGHGTHVAGTIAAIANGQGVVGVAPESRILVGKVLGDDGRGTFDGIVSGIRWAADWSGPNGENVTIISMSLGGSVDYPDLHEAIRYAVSKGILVICAAGNEGDNNADTDEYAYPAAYPEVVAVGAVNTFWMEIPNFSNSNGEVDLVAPGVGISSTYLNDAYAKMSGTSMAAPHAAGAAALVLQLFDSRYGRRPTEAELYAQLIRRTQDLGKDRRLQGNGLINLLIDSGKPAPESVDIRTAIEALTKIPLGIGDEMIIDSPEFWMSLVQKFEADPVKYEEFRFVSLLIRKFYISKL
jgi:major intracellular serine protease